jgi:dethiobiotin synthetase
VRGVFVIGTDTGVGKTVLAASICAALTKRGERVGAFKPVVTGIAEPPEGGWPHDHELLAAATGGRQAPDEVAPYVFDPPMSPHLAAQLEGRRVERARLLAAARAAGAGSDALVCEGVGGLLVPLTPGYQVRDLALDLELPLVIAARPGLGTINHTLLTLEAARAAGLAVAGVVMTPWPAEPDEIERSNLRTVEDLGAVAVSPLPPTRPGGLAEGGGRLPLAEWLGSSHNGPR